MSEASGRKVMIAAPVRDRGWVLPRHLEALLAQTEVEKEFYYIVNDCTDDTEAILQRYGIRYDVRDMGRTHGHIRGQYSIRNLAHLRNLVLEEFLRSDCTHLFSIDTDVIIPPGSLRALLDHDKDVVSMVIRNSIQMFAHNIMIGGMHLPRIPKGVIPVDVTGAVYVIKRAVIEAGVRYAENYYGEDIPFCQAARQLGFGIYCDTTLRPVHAYAKGVDLLADVRG
ncbi:hypothetical protein JQN58_00960 [Aneurinibacillus sp. BA2021]|nr:hypothetical protein [Aneurinibacillus sp. BA2021]